ncbi:hypothetical protein DSECCO2_560300 [anaerobic digester metagenome]
MERPAPPATMESWAICRMSRGESMRGPPAMTTGTQQPSVTLEKESTSPVYTTLITSAPSSSPRRAQWATVAGSHSDFTLGPRA